MFSHYAIDLLTFEVRISSSHLLSLFRPLLWNSNQQQQATRRRRRRRQVVIDDNQCCSSNGIVFVSLCCQDQRGLQRIFEQNECLQRRSAVDNSNSEIISVRNFREKHSSTRIYFLDGLIFKSLKCNCFQSHACDW